MAHSRLAVVSVAVAVLAGCSSTDRASTRVGQVQPVVITSAATVASVTIAVVNEIDFRLRPAPGHRPDGQAVTWPAPTSSDPTVLQPRGLGDCPANYTCEQFKAQAVGTADLIVAEPSGIICDAGCVGIAARAPHRIPVEVIRQGPSRVLYQPPGT